MRKPGRKLRIALWLVGVAVALAFGAQFFLLGRTKVVEVAEGVHVLRTGNGLNDIGANVTVFSGNLGLLLVDAQLGPLSRRIGRLLDRRWGASTTAVVNTHWHPDHSGGNQALAAGAMIVAHASTRERLSSPQEGFGLTKPGSHHVFPPRAAEALPTRLVSDTLTLSIGNGALRVAHYPHAHTDGDLVVYAPDSGVLVVGDLVWPESFPFVDTYNGGSALGLAAALTEISAGLPATTTVVPGHGAPMTSTQLASYATMVNETVHAIRDLKSRGVSLEDAQRDGLDEQWASWSSRLVPTAEWVAMVWRSLDEGQTSS